MPEYRNPQHEPGMDRRVLVFFLAMAAVIFVAQFFLKKYSPPSSTNTAQHPAQTTAPAPTDQESPPPSQTKENEEKQLRLGLGQVLRYWDILSVNQAQVKAVLVVEREPADAGWIRLCELLGVLLAWPDVFPRKIL